MNSLFVEMLIAQCICKIKYTLNIQIVGKDVSQQVLLNMYFNHVFPLREKTQNLGEPMMLVI